MTSATETQAPWALTEPVSLSIQEAARVGRPAQDVRDVVIEPTGGALGAHVRGLDASRPITGALALALKRALQEHHILIYHGQSLTQSSYLAFATWFGSVFRPPQDVPVLASEAKGTPPDVVPVANIEGGYTGNGELTPHSDHQWTPQPSASSLLHALEVPWAGGGTSWYNLAKAYEDLDGDTKLAIQDLRLITYNPFLRGNESRPLYRTPEVEPLGPGFPHPLVITHPESGRKLLYLSTHTEVEVLGVVPAEGRALIEALRDHIQKKKYRYDHSWQVGDIVHWDNLATLHSRQSFDAAERRVLWRVSLAGGRPF